jgi:hypothetical protein
MGSWKGGGIDSIEEQDAAWGKPLVHIRKESGREMAAVSENAEGENEIKGT